MSRDINKFRKPGLILLFQKRCMEELGLKVMITCVDRTLQEQSALWAQGREPLDYVNNLRKLAGMLPISIAENRHKVTWTMASRHLINLEDDRVDNNLSNAFDFAIVYNGKAVWDIKADVNEDKIPDYTQCGMIAESIGLIWGGSWEKNKDFPHCELKKEAV